jgi:hypothetical protein
MDFSKCFIHLLAVVCIVQHAAGCTSSQPATTPTAPAEGTAAAAPAAATPVPSTTPECPDKYEKGIWDYSWDTRWMGYTGNHDIRTIAEGRGFL